MLQCFASLSQGNCFYTQVAADVGADVSFGADVGVNAVIAGADVS